MSVFSKAKGFFNRHRNKLIVGGVLITGTMFLTRYAQQKLKEWQESEAVEFLEKNRKRQHFDSIVRTCNQTALNLSVTLADTIAKQVDTEDIVQQLKLNPNNKLELWNEMKFLVFIKATSSIYSKVMLVLMLRIQLGLIGGYLYKDPNSLSPEIQQKYLSFCQNIMELGFSKLLRIVEKTCRKVLEPIELTKQLKLGDIDAIFWSIQTAIASDRENPIENLKDYIMPDIPSSNGEYGKVISDTVDLLNSEEVKSIATHCVTRNFMLLGEQISEFYTENNLKENGSTSKEFNNPFNEKKPLAKLLPIINGIFSKKPIPDPFLQQLVGADKLQVLSANIYECVL